MKRDTSNITRESFRKTLGMVAIPLEIAAIIVGGQSSVLNRLRDGIYYEFMLDTGAKLVWAHHWNEFAISTYHFDGGDGWKVYELALAELHDMSSVSFVSRTETCAECKTRFKNGFIADRFETLYTVDMTYVCSVECGLNSRQPF